MGAKIRDRLGESFGAFRDVFSNADLRRVELAWTATSLARFAYFVAIAVYAYQEGGAAGVGIVSVLRLLPSAFAAPFTAILGDRYPRKRVMLLTNVGQAITVGAAGVVILAGGPSLLVYVLVVLYSGVLTAFRPAQAALTPLLARTPNELTAANVVASTIDSLGLFVGPAIGGVVLALSSVGMVFITTAVLALVSALVLTGVKSPPQEIRKESSEGKLKTAFAGFGTILASPQLRVLEVLAGGQTLVAGAFNVLVVVSALELLDVGEGGVGALTSAVGVGGLVGAVAAAVLIGRGRISRPFAFGMLLWGVPIALIGIFPNSTFALVLLLFVGIGNTIVDVAGLTLLQRAVPDEVLARVFGAVNSIMIATLGLGAVMAPLLIDLVGIRGALIVTGALLPLMTGLLFRQLARLDRGAIAAAANIDLLRSHPIFAPLPEPTIEALAAKLTPLSQAAGDIVFRQGDHGDRYYLIVDGRVDVEVDGQPARQLGPGDGFGEIALLRDVPRTATVTAATPVALDALERDDFLTAVAGHVESAERADAVATSRVGPLRPSELGAV